MRGYAAMPHTLGRWTTASADIATLPVPCVAPLGVFLVASNGDSALGCGALLRFETGIAEMKRVSVRPTARGRGIGESLVNAWLDHAARLGYSRVRVETAPALLAAQSVYRRLDFHPIAPYREGLLPDTVFLERTVGAAAARHS
jgi:ribosomal protein S18 acetylase RimI-like enzyme